MARPWRIRHKLMLGLGLVVAIMALLLVGTLKGLISYIDTTRTLERKLIEQTEAYEFKESVKVLSRLLPDRGFTEEHRVGMQLQLKDCRQRLEEYDRELQNTIDRRRDPDKGREERHIVQGIEENLKTLEAALVHIEPQAGAAPQTPEKVAEPVRFLLQLSDDLLNAIYGDMKDRSALAKEHYKASLWIVISTCVVGMLLLAGSLRTFYLWLFRPIQDLQKGAERVAQGDFEHRINVRSGDELEELAVAFNDMTGRLQEMYRDLARQVNERSRQLVRSERLASVGFLAAGVAHEINNPLASIAFCSEALEARLSEMAAPALRDGKGDTANFAVIARYLKMIQEEAFRCKRITERLLEFSRSGERKREAVDLGKMVQAVLDVTQHLQHSRGKEIELTGALAENGGKVTAWVNGQELQQVVLNLVVNALESMEEGGKLTIRLGQKEGMAELEFTDTGCGMTDEVLENIFEPFFTRSRTGQGTGLGLTISHRIVTGHGGEIEASSPGPDQGSTFCVRLPMQPPADEVDGKMAA